MKHSIIIKVGENLVYQQSPQEKPLAEHSSTPTEFNRTLPEWEQTSKSFLIKKTDEHTFQEFIDPDYITKGINIPYEFVEIYDDGTKKVARLNKNQDLSKVAEPSLVIKPYTEGANAGWTIIDQPKVNNELRVSFEINIDDETGEPKIKFNNNNRLDLMTQKLLKSFAIKGISKGIEIISVENGDYEVKIRSGL